MLSYKNWSLKVTIPLSGGVLLFLVIVILSSAAYREVRRTSLDAATQRLTAVTTQLAEMVGKSSPLLADDVRRMAKAPAVAAFLRNPTDHNRDIALETLTGVATKPEQLAAIEIWDATGRRLATTGPLARLIDTATTHGLLPRIDDRNPVLISPLQKAAGAAIYAAAVSVNDAGSLGYVVHWRQLDMAPENRAQTQSLIGTKSRLYLGNADGGLWTDLGEVVPGPSAAILKASTPHNYATAGHEPVLGLARAVAGTPWAIAVEFPIAAITETQVQFLKYLLGIAILLLIGSVAIWWIASHRISQPLIRLTAAAEGVGSADFSQLELTRGGGELGRLTIAFNDMVGRLRESKELLEERVLERTSALNETLLQLQLREVQLEESKNAAVRANHAKSDFLAKMSHELRTPLNSIIGFSEILEEQTFGPLNSRQERYVGNVLTSGRQLLELINDILDLSKVEAGHTELFIEPVILEHALSDAMTLVSPMAASKFIAVQLSVSDDIKPVAADQVKLKQIMCNLLSNAIKFTPEGGRVLVTARAYQFAGGGADMVEIAVSDTGIGIPPEHHDRVFDEFEQVDSTYARTQKGTGLGLALSRRLVELHGGTIWVESEVNSGSIFRLTLPVHSDEKAAVPTEDQWASLPIGTGLEGPFVLVVEDDARSLELLVHYLEEDGFRTKQLMSGARAFDAVLELMPDAITLDIVLPGRHGHEVLAQLKADPRTADVPVVIVSMTEDRELGMSLGAVDWLVKPTRREDLVAAVRRATTRKKRDGPATVLLIDDEVETLELLQVVMASQGFNVLQAIGGRAGVARALETSPDLVVVDLAMPDVDGFSVVRQIRERHPGSTPAIVVYSASDLTLAERARLQGSVDGIFKKGSGRQALIESVRSLISSNAEVA